MFLLEAATFLITCLLVWFNSVPVRLMINHGVKIWEASEFHQANAGIKLFWSSVSACYVYGFHWSTLLVILTLFLIMWLVFDIGLAIYIHGLDNWDYIGTTSIIDKNLTKLLGKYAGEAKAIFCLIVIILLNLRLNV